MQYLVLAVLLTIMQASPPLPRKTADNPAQAPADVQSKSAPNQNKPLPAPAPIKTDANGPPTSNGSQQGSEDKEHTIGISKLLWLAKLERACVLDFSIT